MSTVIKLSVHQLVDFLLRKGDIDSRVFNRSTMTEGSNLHAQYQAKQNDNYYAEYPLKTSIFIDDTEFQIEGRADGIIKKNEKHYIIDEIKTTISDLDEFYNENEEWHLGQAKLYAFMFAKEQDLSSIDIQLTYIRQGEKKGKKIVKYSFYFSELDQYVMSLCEDYLDFYRILSSLVNDRNRSLEKLTFPFDKFRNGQKELAKYCYSVSKNGGNLFVEAPTGIGKTMSVLFPFCKSLLNDQQSKIFYLTAKNSGKESAHDAINIINSLGGKLSSIVVTAKDKICFCNDKSCNPDECPYAKGYYSKIGAILRYCLLNFKDFNYEKIVEIANEYYVCPFELELDISLYMDVIICDYNYMYDPISYMHRYFDEDSSHYFALIDEAHNLVDRSKDMYSASIKEEEYKSAKKSVRHSSNRRLKNALTKVTKIFNKIKDENNDGETIVKCFDDELIKGLIRFTETIQDLNKNEHNEITKELLDFYLSVLRFTKIYELFSDNFLCYFFKKEKLIDINLICLDASNFIRNLSNRIKSSVYFSATLSPIDYYVDTLGGDKQNDPILMLPSPFSPENFALLVAPKVSVKYKNRNSTYSVVAEYIKAFVNKKKGNYIVYLPSYEYLDSLKNHIDIDADIYYQDRDMDDLQKEEFISRFISNPKRTCIGFAIIGGSFSEGINLVSDRLIGAVVVGIGMPKINFQSDQVAKYYDSIGLNGKDYAYLYPGMNKVMQAVGRVIRSETDKGAVLLIDERYTINQYRNLFKKEWSNYEIVLSTQEVEEYLDTFYHKAN